MRGERRGIRRSSDPRDRQAYLIAGLRRITGIEPVVPPAVSDARRRPQATDTGFGNRLRLERERRRISLASIATNTKIGLTLLQGLERDDVSRWPSGIFRRSFIRAYAEAIGLDADAISREFFEHFPDPGEPPKVVSPDSAPVAVRKASGDAVLRLTLADPGATLARGVLKTVLRRWAATALDLSVLSAIGAALFIALHQFWIPIAIATLSYYVASIVILGNTPGMCLMAPAAASDGAEQPLSLLSFLKAVMSAIRRALLFERVSRPLDDSAAPDLQPTMPQDRFSIS